MQKAAATAAATAATAATTAATAATASTGYLTASQAYELDQRLFSTFSVDALMELAGLSVACAVEAVYPVSRLGADRLTVLVVCGPGNNGGDGLVAGRHLHHFGYTPHIYYPKRRAGHVLYGQLVSQLEALGTPFLDELPPPDALNATYSLVLDGMFGFSFQGDLRAPFDAIIPALAQCTVPIASIDVPSGWDVDGGDLTGGAGLRPELLISLTAVGSGVGGRGSGVRIGCVWWGSGHWSSGGVVCVGVCVGVCVRACVHACAVWRARVRA